MATSQVRGRVGERAARGKKGSHIGVYYGDEKPRGGDGEVLHKKQPS